MLKATYREYPRYVFSFLRAAELGDYAPAIHEAKDAFVKLCTIFACSDFAEQVIKYYLNAEKQQRVREEAEDDLRFIAASEALRGMTKAPLMAETPKISA